MRTQIDIDTIMGPISVDNPAGEDLRYTLHDEIKEARREDDELEQGEWQRETKRADWDQVLELSLDALLTRTKDIQIAAWLTEALTVKEGFEGFEAGLQIITGFLENLWNHVHPVIEEDDDIEFRIGRLEFLNSALWRRIKEIPLTDSKARAGYSYLQYEESRQVGYESDASKRKVREELIAEGKIPAEEFDAAVNQSSRQFYEDLDSLVTRCRDEFDRFEKIVDDRFGNNAPRLAELRESLEEVERFVSKTVKEKRELEPDETQEDQSAVTEEQSQPGAVTDESEAVNLEDAVSVAGLPLSANAIADGGMQEKALWSSSLKLLKKNGFKKGLEQLLIAASTAPSVRARNRYRLLMAKLCLEAGKPELARPILEDLAAKVDEFRLELWESPHWVAEVLGTLYKCLTFDEPDSSDLSRAEDLFQKICTLDVTQAMSYKH
jgi:type VI secretion system protein ImpA